MVGARDIVGLFGVPFDPLPASGGITIKHKYMQFCAHRNLLEWGYKTPYEVLVENLPYGLQGISRLYGDLAIPTWLQPKPQPSDASRLTFEALNSFIDSGGCLSVASQVRDFVVGNVLPGIPGMIGVDHSSTYGAIMALAEYYAEKIGLVVIDSHFDGVPQDLRKGLYNYTAGYDVQGSVLCALSESDKGQAKRPGKLGDAREDPLTAGNFLLPILNNNLVDPANLVVIGTMDYPPESYALIDDCRIQEYVDHFRLLEAMGVTIVSGQSVRKYGMAAGIENALQRMDASKIYISLDMDVGSLASVYACRFLNQNGLSWFDIEELFGRLFDRIQSPFSLVGFDIMEIDIHKLGFKKGNSLDLTKQVGEMFLSSVGRIDLGRG